MIGRVVLGALLLVGCGEVIDPIDSSSAVDPASWCYATVCGNTVGQAARVCFEVWLPAELAAAGGLSSDSEWLAARGYHAPAPVWIEIGEIHSCYTESEKQVGPQ